MNLYLADGEDPLNPVYQTLVVLAEDEPAARKTIAHEVTGFRAAIWHARGITRGWR